MNGRSALTGAVVGIVVAVAGLTGATRSPARASVPPSRLLVTATEYRLDLSRATLGAGPALVQLSNRGQDPHNLVVRRLSSRGRQLGAPPAVTATAAPGTVLERAYRLVPGRYVLFCSLPGHRRAGMLARLTVRR